MNLSSGLLDANRVGTYLIICCACLMMSCGGSSSSASSPPPLIQAALFGFPSGSAPSNFPNALVSITDATTSANITNATVTMNGVPLTYNGAYTHQEFEGSLAISPGDIVSLVVSIGGKTYIASGTQFSSYPNISVPASGATWSAASDNAVTWSGGAPLTNASYVLGVLDGADPAGGASYLNNFASGTTSFSIPAYYSISAGIKDVIVGVAALLPITNADSNSGLLLGGYDYIPVNVTGMPVTSHTSSIDMTSLQGIASSGTQFVAVGNFGAILTSPDLTTWTSRKSGTTNSIYRITWSGTQFVAVGENGTILTSSDGVTWASHTAGNLPLYGVAWSGTQFVAVGFYGTIFTSPDGITWTSRNAGNDPSILNGALKSVIWSGTQFVAVGRGGVILTSPDGIVWTTQTSPIVYGAFLEDIVWSGTQFVIVGWDVSSCCSDIILTSPDGVTWTPRSSGVQALPSAVAWSGAEFLVVGGPAVNGTILTSPDGIAWTQQASGTINHLFGVTWTGSEFVMVGDSNTILASP